jgi:putative restriction endonuclease
LDDVVRIHHRPLDEIDGRTLRHGLQQHHGRKLMNLPQRRADMPDPERLTLRFKAFEAA